MKLPFKKDGTPVPVGEKLWVDDVRRPPDDTWRWARTNREALLILQAHWVGECSLDHDMGLHDFDPDEEDADMRVAPDAHLQPDGFELAKEMIARELVPPKITIHSWNPVGAQRMAACFRDEGHTDITVRLYERRDQYADVFVGDPFVDEEPWGEEEVKPYLGGHYLHIEPVDDGYRATCSPCEWKGEVKASKSAAERDWHRQHRERGSDA